MLRQVAWLLALCFPLLGYAQSDSLPLQSHLLVKANAVARWIPDRFAMYIELNASDFNPDTARKRVETQKKQILAILKKSGALLNLTDISSLKIASGGAGYGDPPMPPATVASCLMLANFDDLSRFRTFLGNLQGNKEMQVVDAESWRSDFDAIQKQLRQRAIANARSKAEKLAASSGMKLKDIYSASVVQIKIGASADEVGVAPSDMREYVSKGPPPLSSSMFFSSQLGRDANLRARAIEEEMSVVVVYLTSK